jgi:hypothetical protein
MSLTQALLNLRPGAQWSLSGDTIAGLVWLEPEGGQTQPTDAEIEAEVARLAAEYAANDYQRKRRREYPPIDELVLALADLAEGDSTAWNELVARRAAVRAKYPKSGK